MSRLQWGVSGSRVYEAGVDRGVFFPNNSPGVVWDGLLSVIDAPKSTEAIFGHQDGVKYLAKQPTEGFSAKVEAYTYPSEAEAYTGLYFSSQPKKTFDFSYRTMVGDDVSGLSKGYKIHLVYNAQFMLNSSSYKTIAVGNDLSILSWDLETTPISIDRHRASSHLIIDSSVAHPSALTALEDLIYGSDVTDATLPTINEVLALFELSAVLTITDHGDGTWSAEGPSDVVESLNATTFQISWVSAVYIDTESYFVGTF